jgi:hypothetical protein
VNDPDSASTKAYQAALEKSNELCGPPVCLAILCIERPDATCSSQGSGSGHCSPNVGLPL